MGVLGILLVIFITLKVVGVITWSWWLVLLPLWISIVIGFLSFIFGIFLTILGIRLDKKDK